MKILRIIPVILLSFLLSCKKDNPGTTETSVVNIINATVGSGTVKVRLGADTSFSYVVADQVTEGAGKFVYAPPGLKKFTAVAAANLSSIFFDGNVSLSAPVNTLYLSGQLPHIDTTFREERVLPLINKNVVVPDSVLYFRLVNVCVNSMSLKIRINGGIEVPGLAYKGVSEFKSYPAKVSDGVRLPNQSPSDPTRYYMIEVSDVVNTVIATYNVSIPLHRFKTLSLILRGLAGTTGATAPGIFPVIYFN